MLTKNVEGRFAKRAKVTKQTLVGLLVACAVLATGNGGSSATDTLSVQSDGAVNWSVVQTQ